ncbi:MAG: response regulator [Thermodesulfobacteriota bacterium]
MGLLSPFYNLKIRSKILIPFCLTVFIVFGGGSLWIYHRVQSVVRESLERELQTAGMSVRNMVRQSAAASIRSNLRAVAEKNLEVVDHFRKAALDGEMDEETAKKRAMEVLSAQSIGKTGYIYIIDSKGRVVMHPDRQMLGQDVSDRDFVKEQMLRKEGYLEYSYAAPGEEKPRDKALYMTWFVPWDWIISASSYRDEFSSLLSAEDFRKSILGMRLGDSGFASVFDSKGNVIVHPFLSGNILDVSDENGKRYIREMISRKEGRITYAAKGQEGKGAHERYVMFTYLPELDWIVAASIDSREFYAPLSTVKKLFGLMAAAMALIFLPVGFWIASLVSRPLRDLAANFHESATGGRSFRARVKSKDEVGRLGQAINLFMDNLERQTRERESAEKALKNLAEDLDLKVRERTAELSRANRELFESEKRVRSVMDSSPSAMVVYDGEGRVNYVNPAFARVFGWTLEELLGAKTDYVPEDCWEETRSMIGKVRSGEGFRDVETRRRTKDGRMLTVLISAEPFCDERGALIGSVVALLDITERKKAEMELAAARDRLEERVAARTAELETANRALAQEVIERNSAEAALRESERRFRQMAQMLPETVFEAEPGGRFTFLNRRSYEAFGYDPGDPDMPLSLSGLIAPEDRKRLSHELAQVEEGLSRGGAEFSALRKDGTVFPVVLYVDAFFRDGMLSGYRGLIIDISERKQTEMALVEARDEADRASRAKSDFLANMSHEIRTPLNGIVGMVEVLLRSELSREQASYARIIAASSQALLAIINDILDFSKIEAGKLVLSSEPFDLHDLADSAASLLAAQAQEKGLELILRYEPAAPSRFMGDPGRIRQVLLNLAGNAIKFTEKGTVFIDISCAGREANQARMTVKVKDTGIGIGPEMMGRLFSKFTQADSSSTRRHGGTGLGLAISRELTERMGGKMGVFSRPGEGSTFTFTLTLPMLPEARDLASPGKPFSGMTALVVDDNDVNRMVVKELLERWGISCREADSGPAAISSLLASAGGGEPFDMALLDYQMPGMDGVETARRIRSQPEIQSTRLMLLSSDAHRSLEKEAEEVGFFARLLKPVSSSALLDALANAFGESTLQPRITEAVPTPLTHYDARVLVAEDNPVNQAVMRTILNKFGLSVSIAPDGKKALHLVSEESFSLVLMDVQMPEMDGYAATIAIRALPEPKRRIPIVAMTANAMPEDRAKCLDVGMDDYVAKPVTLSAITAVLDRFIGKGQRRGEEKGEAENKAEAFDPSRLSQLIGDDRTILEEFLSVFVEDMPRQIGLFERAVEEGNPESAARHAHRIKGSAADAGGTALYRTAMELEKAARGGNLAVCRKGAARLRTEYDRLASALMDFRARAPGSEG